MRSATTKFLAMVFVLTAICVALQWLWNTRMPEKLRLEDGFWLLGIFAVSVVGVHLMLLNANKTGGNAFIRVFMVSSVLKFFIYLTVLIAFMLFTKDDKKVLALHFLFYYLVFNALEVTMLYLETQKKKLP